MTQCEVALQSNSHYALDQYPMPAPSKPIRCAHCGQENTGGFKFCLKCGQRLPIPEPTPAAPAEPTAPGPETNPRKPRRNLGGWLIGGSMLAAVLFGLNRISFPPGTPTAGPRQPSSGEEASGSSEDGGSTETPLGSESLGSQASHGCGENCPSSEMVTIPKGFFWMGCNPAAHPFCHWNESPPRSVQMPEYQIDRHEVTREDYEACVQAGACPTVPRVCVLASTDSPTAAMSRNCPPASTKTPIDCVPWDAAEAFCRWVGKRLPSEAEWEKAARGADRRLYPWGQVPPGCFQAVIADPKLGADGCGCGSPWPVCSRPAGQSPYGTCDMAGNVWEWVADWYDEEAYDHAASENPRGPGLDPGTRDFKGLYKVVRGGEWIDDWLPPGWTPPKIPMPRAADFSRTSFRTWAPPQGGRGFGFRCAQ